MQFRAPGVIERRVFVALASAYAILTVAVLPWVAMPGPHAPEIIAVCNGGIALADICTALLLAREFLRGGRIAFLMLACAYAFGAAMAVVQALAFPGAIFDERAFGDLQTPAALFLGWRLGSAALFLAAVLNGQREPVAPEVAKRMLAYGLALTVAAVAAILVLSVVVDVPLIDAGRFTPWNRAAILAYFAICTYALARIFESGLADHRLFLWLSIVLVGSIADQVLATFAGGQYTLGWHLGKASAVVSACILLVLWLGDVNARDDETTLRVVAGYGAALVVMLAALVLRWFLTPWLGGDLPFATTFGAVAIAVWAGGWKPGLLAALVGFFAGTILFLDPSLALRIGALGKTLGGAVYWGSCLLIIGLGESLRRARDRYQSAEGRFRVSQEVSLQGYALFSAVRDDDGSIRDLRFEYVNPRGAAIARATVDELLGRGLREALPGTTRNGVYDILVRVVESGEPSDHDVRVERDGIEAWLRNIAVKVGDGVQVSFFDITENKRLEQQLRDRAHELSQTDAYRSEFLAVLSHELRNPLAPLLNGLTLLHMQKDQRALAATREMMARQIQSLRRLIDDLLDVSRIDRGKLELVRTRVPIEAVVHNAVETVQPAIDQKAQQLTVEAAAPGVFVDGDAVRLAQIVSNLIANASKFTAEHGRIDVRVDGGDHEATITVSDDGIGFTPGDEARMFDMFVQLEGNRTTGGGGLGLGLTLARRLAELHGGTVHARSEGKGLGATFVLRLPATRIAPDRLADTIPLRSIVGKRVIVVDDNADAADSLAQVLHYEGFDVRAYHDPQRALADADDFRPAVAFLDINMPGMTGIELGQALRARPWGASLRLVAVTGMGQAPDVDATSRAGFDAHVTKPAPPHRIVRLACEGSGAQAA